MSVVKPIELTPGLAMVDASTQTMDLAGLKPLTVLLARLHEEGAASTSLSWRIPEGYYNTLGEQADSWYLYHISRLVGCLARCPRLFKYWALCKAPRKSGSVI